MIKVVKALHCHIDQIQPRAIFVNNVDWKFMARDAIEASPSITFVNEDEVLAIVGVHMVYPKVAEFWAVTSDEIQGSFVQFHRRVVALLDIFLALNYPNRVQMTVRADYPPGIKWAESLGFLQEGVLKSYGDCCKDYIMMGRVV